MIQTELACPNCGSPSQKRLSGNKFRCVHCLTEWSAEGLENPPQETPELEEGQAMLIISPSIQVHQHLSAKGYLVGYGVPTKRAQSRDYLQIFENRPPVPQKGFLGRVSYHQPAPVEVAMIRFLEDDEEASKNHWQLQFRGESRTEKMSALARELATQFKVRIYAFLMET